MSMRVRTPRRDRARRTAGLHPRRRFAVVCAASVAVTMLAACHSSGGSASSLPDKGGTLHVILSGSTINNLDPQEISLATDGNISHLIDRTLTTTNAAGQLVPDLATDTGRPSQDKQTWEFTLKPGVKWQDGSLVTCQDVQYGIERRYAPAIDQAGGLPYPMLYLKDNATPYKGPFARQNLESIVCVDKRTIQFHLQRPVGDFGYTVSVNTFAPMKASADTDRSKGKQPHATNYAPFSDGPYQVAWQQTKLVQDPASKQWTISHLELTRNPYWDPSTDAVRKAYPDTVMVDYDANKAQVTNDLIQSVGTNQDAINLDSDVTPNFVQQVINDPQLSKRAVGGDSGATRYFAINTRTMSNLSEQNRLGCRQALEYGFDKRTWRFAVGGSIFGQLATSIIPPNLLAHADFDLYETGTMQDGDVAKATKMWKQYDCPSSISVAYPNSPGLPQLLGTVVDAYQKVGIQVNLRPIDPRAYYRIIGNPDEKYDLIYSGWVPDWPNGSSVIPPLFDSSTVTAALADKASIPANLNFSMVTDSSLQDQIDQAYAEPDLSTQYHLWGQIDRTIMEKAYVIPVLYPRVLRMEGTKVRGAQVSPSYGEPDLATIGVVS
jgi:peptide/nickel transport system substrate-binding protein